MLFKARYIMASFVIVVIFFLTVFAFAVVDMSSEKYMPDQFGTMLQINSLDKSGLSITLMGEDFTLDQELFAPTEDVLYRFRGLLPTGPRLVWKLFSMFSGSYSE